MKKILLLVAITLSQGLFAGGDYAITHNYETDTLSREDLSCLACVEKRYVSQHALGKGQQHEEKVQDCAFQNPDFKGTAFQALANRATIALAEIEQEPISCNALGTKKHSAPEGDEKSIKRPCELFTRVLFTQKAATPIEDYLIDLIKKEKKAIRGAMYIFANKRLAQALADQIEKEGIQVSIVVDSSFKEHRSESCLRFLIENGVSVYSSPAGTGREKKIMHHKIARFYGCGLVSFGSYNWSYQANHNDEDLIATNDPQVIEAFDTELDKIMQPSLLLELSDQEVRPSLVCLN